MFTAESKGQQGMDGTKFRNNSGRSIVTVILEKAGGGAGLGFGLDGGRDSPQGDKPLTIKKLFAGMIIFYIKFYIENEIFNVIYNVLLTYQI